MRYEQSSFGEGDVEREGIDYKIVRIAGGNDRVESGEARLETGLEVLEHDSRTPAMAPTRSRRAPRP